jgi:hypothetical protein
VVEEGLEPQPVSINENIITAHSNEVYILFMILLL